MDKKQQRIIMKEKRKNLQREYCRMADEKICRNILTLKEFAEADTVFCFVSTEEEIDTRLIFKEAWKTGKRVVVPRCEGKGHMEAYEIHSFSELAEGSYGILEPGKNCKMISPDEIWFAVVPCLSCSSDGWRLGYGGGFYDRYFSRAESMRAASKENDCAGKRMVKAAICREQLLEEDICREEHDIRMDIVVTERKKYLIGGESHV